MKYGAICNLLVQVIEKECKPMASGLVRVGLPKFPGVDGMSAKAGFIWARFFWFVFSSTGKNERLLAMEI